MDEKVVGESLPNLFILWIKIFGRVTFVWIWTETKIPFGLRLFLLNIQSSAMVLVGSCNLNEDSHFIWNTWLKIWLKHAIKCISPWSQMVPIPTFHLNSNSTELSNWGCHMTVWIDLWKRCPFQPCCLIATFKLPEGGTEITFRYFRLVVCSKSNTHAQTDRMTYLGK